MRYICSATVRRNLLKRRSLVEYDYDMSSLQGLYRVVARNQLVQLFMPLFAVDGGGIMFSDYSPVYVWVHACVSASLRATKQTAWGNFAKFTTFVHLCTKMEWLDFEAKNQRSRSRPPNTWKVLTIAENVIRFCDSTTDGLTSDWECIIGQS